MRIIYTQLHIFQKLVETVGHKTLKVLDLVNWLIFAVDNNKVSPHVP